MTANREVNRILPVSPPVLPPSPAGKKTPAGGDRSFEAVYQNEVQKGRELKFSAHAERRLKERNITLAGDDLVRIGRAVKQAEAKGARESLIIFGDLALITSVRNKTVVTALDGTSTRDHVFTNIDSAVILK